MKETIIEGSYLKEYYEVFSRDLYELIDENREFLKGECQKDAIRDNCWDKTILGYYNFYKNGTNQITVAQNEAVEANVTLSGKSVKAGEFDLLVKIYLYLKKVVSKNISEINILVPLKMIKIARKYIQVISEKLKLEADLVNLKPGVFMF